MRRLLPVSRLIFSPWLRDGACAVSLPVIFSCHGDGALFKSWPLWGGQTFKKKNKKKVKKKKKIKKKNPRGGDDACAVS
jgi:hypothetical protein